ncbi:3497_t:CDS:1, partial [Scutellospora calospora]
KKVNEQVEKNCSFYHLNPIATNLVRHINFGGLGCTETLQNLIREKSLRIEKERKLQDVLTNLQANLAVEREDRSTQVADLQALVIQPYKRLRGND